MKLAIVVPCYNEQEVLHETAACLCTLLDKLILSGEITNDSFILFVNDGSQDGTWNIINELNHSTKYVAGLNLARNAGHQNALMAGLMIAGKQSDAIVSIDADLQDDVAAIEIMVSEYNKGYDIVYGVRKRRDMDSFFKRNTALFFYKMMRSMGVDLIFNHADFRLISQRVIAQLASYKERNLFLRGVIPLIGYKHSTVCYDRKERFAGESKYPFGKMLNFAIDGITSFSVRPIRMITSLGILLFFVSLVAFIYVISSLIKGDAVPGWASLMISVWFFGSIILICIGIIGEYIGKIYMEVKERPRYNISEELKPQNKNKAEDEIS
ncbi:glycosyltransferase family 2 protein [uncultured Bacteroides sp.]|uniref:glycosyltransferase family 2 protein n=1 Tax=uncultured Bacteroides sp. TaxID=162156 RepID=UPI002AA6FC9B|nr:glycosyltransferase family 2 protein [uncultured Bacteroides sp.]